MSSFKSLFKANTAGPAYVFDSTEANSSGRKIYLNDNRVMTQFAGIIEAQGPGIARQIKKYLLQMRATAGSLGSYSSNNLPHCHMDYVGNLRIQYFILQAGSPGKPAGVYITSIEFAQCPDRHQARLYRITPGGNERNPWKVDVKPRGQIETSLAAVNGLTKHLPMAATAIMPDMLKNAYPGASSLNTEGYTLMYNPPALNYRGHSWKTSEQKTFTLEFAAERLAQALVRAQREGREVCWVVHGDGAKIFGMALDNIRISLDKHTVLFAAPRQSMVGLIEKVKKTNMKLHNKGYVHHPDDWSCVKNRLLNSCSIADAMDGLGEDYNARASELREMFGTDFYKATTMTAGIGAAASGAWNEAQNIGTISPDQLANPGVWKQMLVGDGGLGTAAMYGGAALAAWGSVRGLRRLRNTMATNVADPDLNPHMHPFKNRDSFNAHVQKHKGGLASSLFAVLTKERF